MYTLWTIWCFDSFILYGLYFISHILGPTEHGCVYGINLGNKTMATISLL